MAISRDDAIRAASGILEHLASDSLRQFDARLYSQHSRLRHGQPGLPSWQQSEAVARLHDATQLLHAGLLLRSADVPEWRACIRRAGELLEWLSHTAMGLEGVPTRLLSAAAYDISGFPARSNALLRAPGTTTESQILRACLRGDYPTAFNEIRHYWEERAAAGTTASPPTDQLSGWIVQEVVRALGVVCASLRWADEPRTSAALQKLDAVASVLTLEIDPYSWLLARLTAECAHETLVHAWRSVLAPLGSSMSPNGQNALDRYARLNFALRRAVVWPSQQDGIRRLESPGSFALCTPTGSGKTSVAEVAILQALLGGGEPSIAPLCLYLVPSRALAAEVEGKLQRVLQRITDRRVVVTGLYGGTDWGPTDAWLTSEDPTALICTYEKGEALIRFLGPLFLNRLTLVVFDEAHMIQFNQNFSELRQAESRPFRLESLGLRIRYMVASTNCRFVALSAVAAGLEDSLHQWVGGDTSTRPVLTKYRSTRQLIGRMVVDSASRYAIQFDFLDGRSLTFSADSEATPYVPSPIPACPPGPGWTGVEKALRPALLWAALQLAKADDQGMHHAVLISITQGIAGIASDFLHLLEETWQDAELPVVLRAPTNTDEESLWAQTQAVCADYFGTNSYEYRLLQYGIVIHHANMPKLMTRLLIEVVQAGLANVVMATSTLSEGVNIPVETILVPSLLRAGRPMGTTEFRNLAGRAGRPGVATEGQTLVLLRGSSRDTAARRYRELSNSLLLTALPEQPRSPIVAAINDLWREWQTMNSADPEAFLSWIENVTAPLPANSPFASLDAIDGVLLAGLVEHQEIRALTDWEVSLQTLWNGVFNAYQSSEFERQAFIRRGRGIPRVYPDRRIRRKLYRTGLPPSTAIELLEAYDAIREALMLGQPYGNWSPGERLDFIAQCVEVVGRIPRFRSDAEPSVWRGQLQWWMQFANAPQPTERQIAVWHSNISRWFTYRFCWGLGSVIGLAFDGLNDGQLQATSLDQWEQTGFPWIVFWLKELLSWGTLDPPAAFLLGRGLASTRREAMTMAADYYTSTFASTAADILDPRPIRGWSESAFEGTEVRSRPVRTRRVDVEITDDTIVSATQRIRVLPVRETSSIMWVDAAGYPIARTPNMPWNWSNDDLLRVEFDLLPSERTVTESIYL
jgi:hypothetical protein